MHERVSVNALCFPGAELAQMEANWRALEPRRIAFMSQLLPEDLALPRRIIAEGGYRFESMTHLVFMGRHLETSEEAWAPERARLSRAIEGAAALGGRSVYMLTGGHGDMTWEQAAEVFARGIAPCVEQARAAGVKLMVETASPFYAHGHLAHSLRDTLTLADIAGVGVCVDIYACWAEAGLKQTLEQIARRCWLVQVSDYVYGDNCLPSRAVPGDGNVPLARIFDWLLSAGYDGAFDLELIGPRIDAEGHLQAARRAADKVGEILADLGA
jgi:sugar phosphate isomerase/epimerase